MKVVSPETIQVGSFSHSFKPPQNAGIFLAKATCKLIHGGIAQLLGGEDAELICGDKFEEENPKLALKYSSDYAPSKPRTALTLTATCFTPGGKPMESIQAGWEVGAWSKQVLVLGDRKWQEGLFSM